MMMMYNSWNGATKMKRIQFTILIPSHRIHLLRPRWNSVRLTVFFYIITHDANNPQIRLLISFHKYSLEICRMFPQHISSSFFSTPSEKVDDSYDVTVFYDTARYVCVGWYLKSIKRIFFFSFCILCQFDFTWHWLSGFVSSNLLWNWILTNVNVLRRFRWNGNCSRLTYSFICSSALCDFSRILFFEVRRSLAWLCSQAWLNSIPP